MAFDLEKRKIYSSESRQSISGDACIQLSIYQLRPAVKLCNRWTTPLSRIPSRIHLFSRKKISFAALKKTGINVEVTQLDEKIFVRLSRQLEMVNWKAYRKDRNLLQNNPNSHSYLGKNPNVSECTDHNIFQSTLSLLSSNLRLLRALWMNFTSLLNI